MPAPNDLVLIPLASSTTPRSITLKPSQFVLAYSGNLGGSGTPVINIVTTNNPVALVFSIGTDAEAVTAVSTIYTQINSYYTAINS